MKRLSAKEFELLLNTITYESVLSEENFNKFKLIGINPLDWPAFACKQAYIQFLELVHTKGYPYASAMITEAFSVDAFDITEMHDELDVIGQMYKENLKYFKARFLGRELLANPEKADELISQYQSFASGGLKLLKISDYIEKVTLESKAEADKGTSLVVMPGFVSLSNIAGGFNPQRVSLITAKSGFGKTKLAGCFARNMSKSMPVIYFNMEMGVRDFVSMFIHAEADISNTDWFRGNVFKDQIALERVGRYMIKTHESKPIYFTDGKSLDIDTICSAILSVCKPLQNGFVIIDYDQKLTYKSYDEEWKALVRAVERFEEISKITNTHIVVLSQADESGDPKASKRAIQPASLVLNFKQGKIMAGMQEKPDAYYIKAIKNRFGRTGVCVEVEYFPEKSMIKELGVVTEIKEGEIRKRSI